MAVLIVIFIVIWNNRKWLTLEMSNS